MNASWRMSLNVSNAPGFYHEMYRYLLLRKSTEDAYHRLRPNVVDIWYLLTGDRVALAFPK